MVQKVKPLADGVYLDLPEAEYFEQDALGSTDLTRLWQHSEGWWWQSRYCPRATREATKAQTFGRGLHCRLLEGPEAFEARFAIAPDPTEIEGLLRTSEDILAALDAAGAPRPSSKARKSDLIEMAKIYCPDRKVWDLVLEAFRDAAGDREVLTAEEAEDIALMCEVAREEPNMAAVMDTEAGVSLTEVSVFWTLPCGTRLRYRFDKILPDGNVDLKTVGNARADFASACARRIRDEDLEIQMAMSFWARHQVYRAVEEKRMFLGDRRARAWLRRFPAEAPLDRADYTIPGWAWLWVFVQRPDPVQGRAPVVLPVREIFGSDLHRDGWRKLQTGLERFRQGRERHTLHRPWTRVMPVHDVQGKLANHLQLPPWGVPPLRVEGEEEALTWRKGR